MIDTLLAPPALVRPIAEITEHGAHWDVSWWESEDEGWTWQRKSGVNFPAYRAAYNCLLRHGAAYGVFE